MIETSSDCSQTKLFMSWNCPQEDFNGNSLSVSVPSAISYSISHIILEIFLGWVPSSYPRRRNEPPPFSIPTLLGGEGDHLFLLQATSLQKVSQGVQPAKKKLGLSSCSVYYSEVSEVLGNPLIVSGEASSILYQERGLPRNLYQHLQLFGETNKKMLCELLILTSWHFAYCVQKVQIYKLQWWKKKTSYSILSYVQHIRIVFIRAIF